MQIVRFAFRARTLVLYSHLMLDYEKIYPVRKLKRCSTTDLENAIASALSALVGVGEDEVAGFGVNIRSMHFSDDQELKLELSVETRYLADPDAMSDGMEVVDATQVDVSQVNSPEAPPA
jgi:hypothetical protein